MPSIDAQDYLRLLEDANRIAFVDIEATGLRGDYNSTLVVSIKPYHGETVRLNPITAKPLVMLSNNPETIRQLFDWLKSPSNSLTHGLHTTEKALTFRFSIPGCYAGNVHLSRNAIILTSTSLLNRIYLRLVNPKPTCFDFLILPNKKWICLPRNGIKSWQILQRILKRWSNDVSPMFTDCKDSTTKPSTL
jgi:hypothetical protein